MEIVILEGDEVVLRQKQETAVRLQDQLEALSKAHRWDRLVATGYGRCVAQRALGAEVVTELKAYATAAAALYPDLKTVLDIGGQDMKAIALGAQGNVERFEMNDRCAAGTGKFLEIMAMTLDVPVEGLGTYAMGSKGSIEVNNTCTVFAESEVVSLLSHNVASEDVAMTVCRSAAVRAKTMVAKVSSGDGRILFAGGVALNSCVASLLEELTERRIVVPSEPQFLGAYGAARSRS
jgi:predicted CoA-substrate-specific enzyme activase